MLLKRLREAAGMTQVGMAHYTGVSKQHIMRIEQGVYAKLNPEIAKAYAEISISHTKTGDQKGYIHGISPTVLIKEYEAEVAERRRALMDEIHSQVVKNGGWGNAPTKLSDFRLWLGYPSRIGFCKALACHPAAVLNYEKGLAHKLPSDVIEGLRSVGTPQIVIDRLR